MRTFKVLLAILIGVAVFAQTTKKLSWVAHSGTSWTKYYKTLSPRKIVYLEVAVDTTTASGVVDTLYISWDNDTSGTGLYRLFATSLGGEVKQWDGIYTDTVKVKGSIANIPYRIELR